MLMRRILNKNLKNFHDVDMSHVYSYNIACVLISTIWKCVWLNIFISKKNRVYETIVIFN